MTRTMAYAKTTRTLTTARSQNFGSLNVPISLAESIFPVEVSLCSASVTEPFVDRPKTPYLQAHHSTLFMRFLEHRVHSALLRRTITRIRLSSLLLGPRKVNTMRTSQMFTSKRPQSSLVVWNPGLKHYEWVNQLELDVVCNGLPSCSFSTFLCYVPEPKNTRKSWV